ncbi:hypothetical protein EDB19DRAFT_1835057 [Suillus lakei]|nr:hypothetical protein EDB19DRAFT_1835057 [Suillus lakei]
MADHFDIALGPRSGEVFALFLGHVGSPGEFFLLRLWVEADLVFDPACWADFGVVGWAAGSFVLWGVGLFGWFWFLVSGGVQWVDSRWVEYVYDVVAGWVLVFVFGCRRVPGSGYMNLQVGHRRASQWFEDALPHDQGGGNQNHSRDQAEGVGWRVGSE